MKRFNLKEQIHNKFFWLSVVSLVMLTAQQFGLDFIPEGFDKYINTILSILCGMGLLNDNSTPGLGTIDRDI